MHYLIRALALVVSISLVAGCAGSKETVLPQDGPSMQAIYETHFERMGAEKGYEVRNALSERGIVDGTADLAGYTRDAYNELDTLFPRLPNPTLVLYVFPHLTAGERVPVPGYATTFPLYERVEYALPGEVPPRRR